MFLGFLIETVLQLFQSVSLQKKVREKSYFHDKKTEHDNLNVSLFLFLVLLKRFC